MSKSAHHVKVGDYLYLEDDKQVYVVVSKKEVGSSKAVDLELHNFAYLFQYLLNQLIIVTFSLI